MIEFSFIFKGFLLKQIKPTFLERGRPPLNQEFGATFGY